MNKAIWVKHIGTTGHSYIWAKGELVKANPKRSKVLVPKQPGVAYEWSNLISNTRIRDRLDDSPPSFPRGHAFVRAHGQSMYCECGNNKASHAS